MTGNFDKMLWSSREAKMAHWWLTSDLYRTEWKVEITLVDRDYYEITMVNAFILTMTLFFNGIPCHSREDFCPAVLWHPLIDSVCKGLQLLAKLYIGQLGRLFIKLSIFQWEVYQECVFNLATSFQHIGMEWLNVLTTVRLSAYRPLGRFWKPMFGCK